MSIKHILAFLHGTNEDGSVLNCALQVARKFQAHIDAVHVPFNATDIALVTANPPFEGPVGFAEAFQEMADRMSWHTRYQFDTWFDKNGLHADDTVGAAASARFLKVEGMEVDAIVRLGRLSDLIVIARPAEGSAATFLALEPALFDTSRPVLMVPPSGCRDLFRLPVVAWNGSAEAAQAIGCALPFLRESEGVVAVYAAPEKGLGNSPDSLIDYLRWHGIAAEPIDPDKYADIGPDILAQAERRGSGLLVMGAYTHGRLRQIVFGGVTRHIVNNVKIPVLMAH